MQEAIKHKVPRIMKARLKMEMAAAEMLYSVKREEMEEGRDPEGDRQVEHPCVYHLDLMLTVLGKV